MSRPPSPTEPGGHSAPSDILLTLLLALLLQLNDKVDDVRGQLAEHHKDFHTVEELAKLTGRTPYTIRRWISEQKVTAIRIAEGGPRGRLLIPHAELERLVAAGQGGNIPAPALS